jgi:hypothetical protein
VHSSLPEFQNIAECVEAEHDMPILFIMNVMISEKNIIENPSIPIKTQNVSID